MYFNKDQKELVNSYLNKSFDKKLLPFVKGLDKAEAIKEYIQSGGSYERLVNTLWTSDIKHITDVFSGKDFEALRLLLENKYAETFKNIWDRSVFYTYTTGYIRRSYRTNISSKLYISKNIEKLKEYIYLVASDFSLENYLKDNKSGYAGISVIADIISIEIDKNNETVLSKITDIIYNDNNTAIVTREIIQGVLMSKKEKAYSMIGELLLASKLQEGLRQSIVESMDECSRESFVYLLKVILDNNLSRFSSIARAFGTWTGLGLEVGKPKVIIKCLEAAYDCLTSKDYLRECLNSDDNQLIYIGIWATAFDEVESIAGILNTLLGSDEKYKRMTALLFLCETQFTKFRHQVACRALEDDEVEVVALAVKNLFGDLNLYSLKMDNSDKIDKYKIDNNSYGVKLFNQLRVVLDKMPKKELEFSGIVFPWINMKLTAAEIIDNMLLSVAKNYDNNIVDVLLDYRDKMSVDTRDAFAQYFLKQPDSEKQRIALLELCGDRGTSVRNSAYKIVSEMSLNKEEYILIENFLQYKSGDVRKNSIKLLLEQSSAGVYESVRRLMESSNESKRLGAIELVGALETNKNFEGILEASKELIMARGDISQKEKILAKNMMIDESQITTLDRGLGLFDKKLEINISPISMEEDFNIKAIFSLKKEEIEDILLKLSNMIHENRDFEYEAIGWDNTKNTITLGGSDYLVPFSRGNFSLSNYPISEKVRAFGASNKLTCLKLVELDYYLEMICRTRYTKYKEWFIKFLDNALFIKEFKSLEGFVDKLPYNNKVRSYVDLLLKECDGKQRFDVGKAVSEYLYSNLTKEEHTKNYEDRERYNNRGDVIIDTPEMIYWLDLMKGNSKEKDNFIKYFNIAYNYYKACDFKSHAGLAMADFGRAFELGIVDENEVYKELLSRPLSSNNINDCTNPYRRKDINKFESLIKLRDKAIDGITAIEVNRGELNTDVTHIASSIFICYGVKIFVSIILNSEKDTYVRGYNFVSGDCTKKQMLSHLLKYCFPREGENAKTLEEVVGSKKVTDKQLIEAAMYAPQWLDIVSEYIGYPGLKSVCWYFHAHVNDIFSEEKAAIVARYSPISAQDFRDGAFDGEWFMDAYNTVGEKRFKLVYDSAKYIAGGGLHKRSQLFADGVLGKLDIEEVKNRIVDKRNKDYLLAYGLIPIKSKEDLLNRYEYIHQYLKESKQFGAQRQASEGRSVNIALLNLARNSGYSDVNRLSWNMETAKLDSIKQYLVPSKLEDIEIKLSIDELGKTNILCNKNGNELRDIPSKFKKHEQVLKLKEIKKSLNDQYIRARGSFEELMEKGEEFEAEELIGLCENPVISPIIKSLVYISGNKLGFIEGQYLVDYNENKFKLEPKDRLRIAHPVHMYEAGEWSLYQKYVFNKKLIQPFKQVFRELYLPNADELSEGISSRRYAGHQVQPKKTLALLKTRGWLASNEEGIQKVYYKENIIATIYALADWFSPSDIEAPTIEVVGFVDRKTLRPVRVEEIPRLIFSEIMRDVDLVVSVAHVGGVDPEASLSTIEIRRAIVDELLRMLKLDNVILKGSHAHISGIHGEYTVHLGSGVVHKMGTGSLNILPVHSSHRGRIFLPFVDDDPKSAEIMSKIILLGEDKKLKDPSILVQITQ